MTRGAVGTQIKSNVHIAYQRSAHALIFHEFGSRHDLVEEGEVGVDAHDVNFDGGGRRLVRAAVNDLNLRGGLVEAEIVDALVFDEEGDSRQTHIKPLLEILQPQILGLRFEESKDVLALLGEEVSGDGGGEAGGQSLVGRRHS